MKNGLVLGKFMPVHNGHLALIDFALENCDRLTVLLCHHQGEPISGGQREEWLREIFTNKSEITLFSFQYNPKDLPDSSEPKPAYAKKWAEAIKSIIPETDFFFSSEEYGNNLAFYLNAEHKIFDRERKGVPVSSSLIRKKPITYWSFLPEVVQPYFVKKIVIVGSESTGKSTLAKKLATHYKTSFVPEMAREIIEHTNDCTYEDLFKIAKSHADSIALKTKESNKLLFCDTDVNITKSYSLFLFEKELQLPQWIEEINKGDLYLFLEVDSPYVQDGTRLPEAEREKLNTSHKKQLNKEKIDYKILRGNWNERFLFACSEVDDFTSRY